MGSVAAASMLRTRPAKNDADGIVRVSEGKLVNLNFVFSALAAVALHEASHVLAALALGVKVKRIGLSWRGPYVVRQAGTPPASVLISLAGPLANLLTAVACLLIGHGANLCFTSLVLGAFNLLPLPSSDGLRAARLLWSMAAKTPQFAEIQVTR